LRVHQKIFAPIYSAAAKCSGLFEVLGSIVEHMISQDGIGFPHLIKACFYYIAVGEHKALQNTAVDDTGDNCSYFVKQVYACIQILILQYGFVIIHGCSWD